MVSKIACRMEVYRRNRHPEDEPGIEFVVEERFRLYHTEPDGTLIEQTGLAFEDLVPGETFVHWPGRTFDFAESRLHALRSLEINPRWSDAAYLRKHKAIEPAIFEPLVIGVVTALTTRTLGRVVANLGWTNIELPRPVRPGETIYEELTMTCADRTRVRCRASPRSRPAPSSKAARWCAAISGRCWSIAAAPDRTRLPGS